MNTIEIGHWYKIHQRGELVEVIAVDEEDDVVEFQHYDGEVEKLATNTWHSFGPVEMAPPEDWSGPFETDRQDLHPDELFNDYLTSEMPRVVNQ